MEKSNRMIPILSLLCIFSVIIMMVCICINKKDKTEFVPPAFDETAKQGIPSDDEIEQLDWAEICQDGMPYRTAVCGNIHIINGNALIYLTNYADNNVWLKLRMIDTDGNIVVETGLIKPGEYIDKVTFTKEIDNGEKIKLKIMAYEPETYYSAGSIVLNTTIRIGE